MTTGARRSKSEQPQDVLDVEQCADLLNVCTKTLRKMANSGKIPARRAGNQWRFNRSTIMEWLNGNRAA